jgi:hypothetical protein
MNSDSHTAVGPESGAPTREETLRTFVERRTQVGDLIRRQAWQRCTQLRAAHAHRLAAVRVLAAGGVRSQK